MTNISVNYDDEWLLEYWRSGDLSEVFTRNVEQALRTGEPGFSFNFFDKRHETLRNACTEVTAMNSQAPDGGDDSDVCNLGSINFAKIESIDELRDVVELATKFLICGTMRAHLPYEKVARVREKNRRLGLGIMGMHEWLVQRGERYEVTPELHRWLHTYKAVSDKTSDEYADRLGTTRPVGKRAIAPNGSIGILAGTTTGISEGHGLALSIRSRRLSSAAY